MKRLALIAALVMASPAFAQTPPGQNLNVPNSSGGGGGGIAAGAAITGCVAQSSLFVTSTLTVGCVAAVSEADSGDPVTLTGHLVIPNGAAGSPSIALGGTGSTTGIFGSNTTFIIANSGVASVTVTAAAMLLAQNALNLPTGNSIGWNADTFLSRSAASTLRVGATSGTATGNLLVSGIGPGTIYSAAGTAVPACAAGTNGWTIVASDVTTVTYRAAYVSGGANLSRLFCVNGTGWLAD